jgi:hypothetical protein
MQSLYKQKIVLIVPLFYAYKLQQPFKIRLTNTFIIIIIMWKWEGNKKYSAI